jgi:hypothetical protein
MLGQVEIEQQGERHPDENLESIAFRLGMKVHPKLTRDVM